MACSGHQLPRAPGTITNDMTDDQAHVPMSILLQLIVCMPSKVLAVLRSYPGHD